MKQKNIYNTLLLLLMMSFSLTSFSQYEDSQLGHDGFMGDVKMAKITSYQVVIKDGQESKGGISNYQTRSYLKSGKLQSVINYNAEGTVVRTQEYTFDKDEKLLEFLDRMGDMIIKREAYNYDKSANLIEKITFDGEGSIDSKVSNSYNKKNQLIESSNYSNFFDELKLDQRTQFEYDKDGNKIKESSFGPEGENWGSAEWKYDASGNAVERLNLTETGEIKIRQVYIYDKDDVLTTRKSFDKDGNLKNEANLDHLGQPLTLIRYDKDGNISRKSGNQYDKFGNINAELRYGPDGTESIYVHHKYIYDDNNNWIQQTAYQGGQAVFMIGREVTYY